MRTSSSACELPDHSHDRARTGAGSAPEPGLLLADAFGRSWQYIRDKRARAGAFIFQGTPHLGFLRNGGGGHPLGENFKNPERPHFIQLVPGIDGMHPA